MTQDTFAPDTSAAFVVAYEGPALSDHTMAVRDLAPALLALGQAFDRANAVLNGDRAQVSLEIRATQGGSFEIALQLLQAIENAGNVLSSDFVSTAANLKELIIGGGGLLSLIGVLKRFRGQRPQVVQPHEPATDRDDDAITLEMDNLRIRVPARMLELLNDSIIRQHLEAVVRPVKKAGIDRVVFKDENVTVESVEKAEADFFQPEGGASLDATEIVIPRQRLRPVSASFIRKGKWRLTDGEKSRWYTILDQDFIRTVQDGETRIGSKDLFIAEVVMTQTVDNATGDLKLDYTITNVISHIEPPHQPSMLDRDS